MIIPARDEAARLPATLDALLQDPSPDLAVVVFDDGSTDATPAFVRERAAADLRLRLMKAADAPVPGEPEAGFGKPLALARAADRAAPKTGPVLFLDADVVLAPGALGGLVAAFERSGAAALSGAPRLRCESLVEAMLVPAFVSALASRYAPRAVHDDERPTAFLNGQVILIDAEALAAVGGWRSVKDHVLEDVALGRRLKQAGYRLRLADLRALLSTRMYTSWAEIREGFGKNAVEGRGGPLATLSFGLLSAAVAWAPWASLVGAAALGERALLGGAAACVVVVVGTQALLRRWAEVPAWPAVLNPVAYAAVAFVYAKAALRAAFGGTVTWKGRTYRAR